MYGALVSTLWSLCSRSMIMTLFRNIHTQLVHAGLNYLMSQHACTILTYVITWSWPIGQGFVTRVHVVLILVLSLRWWARLSRPLLSSVLWVVWWIMLMHPFLEKQVAGWSDAAHILKHGFVLPVQYLALSIKRKAKARYKLVCHRKWHQDFLQSVKGWVKPYQ